MFLAPLGHMNAPRAAGKSLVPDPERAPLVRRAFDECATGRFTKQQLLQQVTARGLRNRRGQPLSSQASGMLLRNQLYAGIVDVAEYEVRGGEGTSSRLSARTSSTGFRPSVGPNHPAITPATSVVRVVAHNATKARLETVFGMELARPRRTPRSDASRRHGQSRTSGSARSEGRWPRR